jgi:hypothetical protein
MMTMLTDTRSLFNQAPDSSTRRDIADRRPAAAHLAMIKRFCISALTVLAAAGAIAAIIALKAAIFFWVFHYF